MNNTPGGRVVDEGDGVLDPWANAPLQCRSRRWIPYHDCDRVRATSKS